MDSMLDIKARILLRSVYIPEETITCEIILTNKASKTLVDNVQQNTHQRHASDTKVYASNSWNKGVNMEAKVREDGTITIAYASAQIYCQCNLNERRLRPLTSDSHNPSKIKSDRTSKNTSFSPVIGEKGHCLYSSEATVLFCDLKLKKGESKKYIYKETLPYDIPPSYKGQHIKLSYKVCFGIGRIGKPLTMIRLPFRLFELKGIFKSLKQKAMDQEKKDLKYCSTPMKSEVSKINPFLREKEAEKYSKLDVAMDALTAFTVKRNLNTYNIHSINGGVGKFCLSKHYYRIGEDILGTFDFDNCPIACVKYAVSLQVEETITKNCLIQPSDSNLVQHITLSRHEECCYLSTKTNFLLPIPVTATPEFTHKIVSVHWRLHFEFTIVKDVNEETTTSSQSELSNENKTEKQYLNIPSNLRTELMLWDLPIHVVATNPIQASLMMQAESSESITLAP